MRIIVVDDDAIVVTSLKMIIEASGNIEVVATGHTGVDAVALYEKHQPNVVLIDIQMPIMTGLEAAEQIIRTNPEAKVLFLTTFADDAYIYQALTIGAKGYILKQDFDNIVTALQAVNNGQNVFGSDIVARLTQSKPTTRVDYLALDITEKEQEVIELVAKGLNNKEISSTMYLSEGTVRNYLSNILEKLDLRDRTQLAIWYYR